MKKNFLRIAIAAVLLMSASALSRPQQVAEGPNPMCLPGDTSSCPMIGA